MAFMGLSTWWPFGGMRRSQGVQSPMPRETSAPAAAPVTVDTAMQVSAFFACVRLIAETVASLPMNFFHTGAVNGLVATDYPLQLLFRGKPNRYQTPVEFWETLLMQLSIHGNAYALKTRGVSGQIVSLLPLMSSQMETRLLQDGSVVHAYYTDAGVQVLSSESVWHTKLFGNGIVGLSPLAYARNSIGIAIAGEDRIGNVFRNGAKPTGVLMTDKTLKKEQRDQIRASFADLAEGNNDSLIVLEANMKYESVSMSPVDIQFLESRRFQIEDICRFMGVPSVLVNDTANSTGWGSGIQQLINGWYKLGLRPYLERIESSIGVHLMSTADRLKYYAEFDLDALLRADQAARFDAWNKGINGGFVIPNEARAAEGLPPADGGDVLLVNSTMVPITSAIRPQQTQVTR